jgi:hypothetical protein
VQADFAHCSHADGLPAAILRIRINVLPGILGSVVANRIVPDNSSATSRG